MERLVKGDVIVLAFPFSDYDEAKRRPAVVVAGPFGDDAIVCQITSRMRPERFAIELGESDFSDGSLRQESFVRANVVFTVDKSLVLYRAGRLKESKVKEIESELVRVFTG